MTRPPDKHLDELELESLSLCSNTGLSDLDDLAAASVIELQRHVATCEECGRRVLMYEKARRFFLGVTERDRATSHSNCRVQADWFAVAAGVLDHADALPLLEHAARCPYCGPLLHAAVEDLADDATPAEAELLAVLPSAGPRGQALIAETLRNANLPPAAASGRSLRSTASVRFGIAAAAVLLLSAGGIVAHHYFREPAAGRLIADAYSEDRILELRIPGAAYAASKTQRGSETSNLDRPRALLRAESIIAEQLRKNPNDAALLDAEAQADLLDGNYEHAIDTARRALETEPDSSAALLDLGTAYFLRAEQSGNDEHDYALAIEYQGRVLARSPNNTVALFNRAISEQRAYLYDRAVEDWKRFLDAESDPAWRSEGKRQYEALLQQIQRANHSSVTPVQDLTQVSQSLRTHTRLQNDPGWPRSRDEAYLDLALKQWLGAAASPDLAHEAQSLEALDALADEFSRRHSDFWLADLLTVPHTRAWSAGVRELSTSLGLIANGDSGQGVVHARRSLEEFRAIRNDAGVAASAFALARGLAHAQQGKQCLPVGLEGLRATKGHRYPWVITRLWFEVSTCSSLQGNIEDVESYAKRGQESAQAAGYPVLALIGRMFLDGVDSRDVAESESWNRVRAGLAEFWSSPYPAYCAGEFYTDLGFAAKSEHLWNFAEAAGEESVVMFSQQDDRVVRAASHAGFAQAALGAGDLHRADIEFQTTSKMFAEWGTKSQEARTTLEIERASLELRQGWLDKAKVRLDDVRMMLPEVSDTSNATLFHETLGELYLRSGKVLLAEQELLEAIRLMETQKNSVSSEAEFLTWQLNESQTFRLLLEIYSTRDGADARSLAFLEWYQGAPLRIDSQRTKKLETSSLRTREFPVASEDQMAKEIAALRPDRPVLVWASFPSVLVIWEVDSTGVHRVRTHVDSRSLNATASRFARLCADPGSDTVALQRDARQLYRWLIEPVTHYLPSSGTLIIEPDSALRTIAFVALQDPGNRYLGERFSLIESPGLVYAQALRPAKAITSRDVALAIGDPLAGGTSGKRLARLPDADREAQDVADHFDGHSVLDGSNATLSNVTRLLPGVQVFHFAGHAMTQAREPGLLLASVGGEAGAASILSGHNLSPKDLRRLQLAVLSGCETAVADQGLVDPGSLVRIFLRSGVPQVVASKWRVDSRASSETMRTFYAQLLRGDRAAKALADSERAIRSNPATSHPYYWAAFSAFGA